MYRKGTRNLVTETLDMWVRLYSIQSLTIALLYSQPRDHIDYLVACLERSKSLDPDKISWDTFLPEDRPQSSASLSHQVPLPPIHGKTTTPR